MTERERLLAVLRGEMPDRTPWYGDLSWWHAAHMRDGTLPPEFADAATGYLRMHQAAGVGIYLYAPFLWHQEYDETVSVSVTAEDGLNRTEIATPVGTVRSVTQDLPESSTSANVEHFVKAGAIHESPLQNYVGHRVNVGAIHESPLQNDLAVMRWLAEHQRVTPNYEAFEACDALWGDQGFACALSPVCTAPIQSFLTRLAGVETTVALLHSEARDELELTFDAMERADDAVFEIIAAGPAVYVEFPENLSAEITGRRLMRGYAVPYWRRRIEQLHAAGKIVGIHNDGTLRGSLDLLIEAGFDVVESATPAPVGDMSLEEIRDTASGRIIVWGGLPGALFSPLYSDEYFDSFVRETLAVFPRGSGFVLGVADQVPPDAAFERICRVQEILEAMP
jgi:hypothetical protein